ncbi:hypothetical protein D3C76_1132770 [compost metagenome]
MSAVSLFDSLADELRLIRRSVAHGVQQRQSRFAFVQVVTDVFTEGFAIRTVIKQIINQLERCAQITTIVLQSTLLLLRAACQNAGALSSGFKQTRSFAVNHAHVVFFGDVRVIDVHQLQDFTFSDNVDGL